MITVFMLIIVIFEINNMCIVTTNIFCKCFYLNLKKNNFDSLVKYVFIENCK